MLSRVASKLFWMSRYMERAENIARFLDVNLHLVLDLPGEEANQWASLVSVTGDEDYFKKQYGEPTPENVRDFLTFDENYSNSIVTCLRRGRENARTVREAISSELWRQVNEMYHEVNSPNARRKARQRPNEFYTAIKDGSTLFKGLSDATMSHGEAWQFMRLGRMLERADKTSRILDVKYFILLPDSNYVGTPYDNIQWSALLKSASALEMYRMKYRTIHSKDVVEFLILDNEFPRAIHFCVAMCLSCMNAITGSAEGAYSTKSERLVGKLSSELDYTTIDEIYSYGFHEYIDKLQASLNDVGEALNGEFFGIR